MFLGISFIGLSAMILNRCTSDLSHLYHALPSGTSGFYAYSSLTRLVRLVIVSCLNSHSEVSESPHSEFSTITATVHWLSDSEVQGEMFKMDLEVSLLSVGI